ncbi:hydroxyacylglutathione hydrolase [Escherichia coli]|uniref:hydroxyacylglutathione hydrolase n=1 Tax=Escherichia coli TaxID=562 RepID=UPI0029ED273C|nr:hydroxyacylglutathione hydrolase [Escherichia coli]
MNLNSIPAFDDNYIWVLNDEAGRCLIVDPGDAEPVLNAIAANNWQPEAIFLTHHHHDHVGGVKELVEKFPQIVVYGPQETQDKGTTQVVKDGETAFVLGHEFSVIATPGHTLGHICYFSKPYLFCGDTLFSGGCGRLFEGTASQMYQSLKKLSALPDDTLVCCAHEYTLSNMKFALSILPHDLSINDYYRKVKELRAKNQITLPVILKNERQINVLLRTEDIDLINVINEETLLQQPEERFAWLRSKKDRF